MRCIAPSEDFVAASGAVCNTVWQHGLRGSRRTIHRRHRIRGPSTCRTRHL
jgi:hypothetical protein